MSLSHGLLRFSNTCRLIRLPKNADPLARLTGDPDERRLLATLIRFAGNQVRKGATHSGQRNPDSLDWAVDRSFPCAGANRFNHAGENAWYAALEPVTAAVEVAHHLNREYSDIEDCPAQTASYLIVLADLVADFHDLRGEAPEAAGCLDPDDYGKAWELADRLRAVGRPGIVYPSVRHDGGTCVVCFERHLLDNLRSGEVVDVDWQALDHGAFAP